MKKRLSYKEPPSRVLLICVYDTVAMNITNEAVYSLFAPYGNITKILIFERGQVTKFFLEYNNIPSAQQAKNELDGTKLFENICKMNIYYSNFQKVDLKHQTTQGINIEPSAIPQVQNYYNPSVLGYSNSPLEVYPFNPYAYYFQPQVQNTYPLIPSQSYYQHTSVCAPQIQPLGNSPKGKQKDQIQKTIQNDIDQLLKSGQKPQVSEEKGQNICPQLANEGNKYLCLSIVYDISNRHLYSIFSNFGNISFVKQTHNKAYIKFRSFQFAAVARSYLSGYTLLGNTLELNFIEDIKVAQPCQQEFSNVTFFDSSFDRFNSLKSISINPPSATLHISSIRRDSCKEEILRQTFQQFGQVIGVSILQNKSDKNMALVQFQHIQDSFYALAQMHGKMFSGRKLQISFTKSRIN